MYSALVGQISNYKLNEAPRMVSKSYFENHQIETMHIFNTSAPLVLCRNIGLQIALIVASYKVVVGNAYCGLKEIHKQVSVSPDWTTFNQIERRHLSTYSGLGSLFRFHGAPGLNNSSTSPLTSK